MIHKYGEIFTNGNLGKGYVRVPCPSLVTLDFKVKCEIIFK